MLPALPTPLLALSHPLHNRHQPQGYAVEPGGVRLQPHGDNRHSKLALVEFESPAEARRALVRVVHPKPACLSCWPHLVAALPS